MPRLPVVGVLLALASGRSTAQLPASDSAHLVVALNGRVVGTEDYAFRMNTADGGATISLVATATSDTGTVRVAITAGPRRVTLRFAAGTSETAREYPGGDGTLVADERVLSLYALAARLAPGPVTVYGPPPGGRRTATLTDAGLATLPGMQNPLRHMILRSGEDTVEVWFDGAGRLVRVTIPSRGLAADRSPPP